MKLADFGVAAKLGELETGRDELQQNVVGTPYWMAPEVGRRAGTDASGLRGTFHGGSGVGRRLNRQRH